MAKVTKVQASKMEKVCGRCGRTIAVGESYQWAQKFRGAKIVRCNVCGVRHWETSTSDYTLTAGELVDFWHINYDTTEDGISSIITDVESLIEILEDQIDNTPENLQGSERYSSLEDKLSGAQDCLQSLEELKDKVESWEDGDEELNVEEEINEALCCLEM